MGSLNKYSRNDYINNSKWQNKSHDKFERILELYNYDTRLENKYSSAAIKEKKLIVNNIIELIFKYNNNLDFDIPLNKFKRLHKDENTIEWFINSQDINYWYTLEKNKHDNWQIWIKSERHNNYNQFIPKGLMYIDYVYNSYNQMFNNLTLLSKLSDLKICYEHLINLKRYSIMEQPINSFEDIIL